MQYESYFASFIVLAELSVKAAEPICGVSPQSWKNSAGVLPDTGKAEGSRHVQKLLSGYMKEADAQFSVIMQRLERDFMTPFDREDILNLARFQVQAVHGISLMGDLIFRSRNAFEQKQSSRNIIKTVKGNENIEKFAESFFQCCHRMYEATLLLREYKKPKRLSEHLAGLRRESWNAERVYGDVVAELVENYGSDGTDFSMVFVTVRYADGLLDCCRKVAACGKAMETIAVKN